MTTPRCTSLLLLAALFALFCLMAVAPASADEPPPDPPPAETPAPPSPEPSSGGLIRLLPDPKQWAAEVFDRVLVNLLQGLASAFYHVVDGVLNSSLNFITQTPPSGSYASPTVAGLWGVVRLIANAALVLVALWGGFNVTVRDQLGSPYHEAMELFPRLALGALLVNTSLSWAQIAIDANNAMCHAIGQAGLPAWERADTSSRLLVGLVAALIYLVTSLLLLLQALMRLALVDVLLVVSPLALLCWVLPQTQGWARLWSTVFFGAVFTQFVQVLALKLGGAVLTELTPMAADSALLAVFLGVAILVLTLKIPSLMRNHLDDGLGFVRYYVYRRAARGIDARGTGGEGTQ
ncbi:MAG: hypothetical protein U0822_08350 [Anaerolineae bacterium]